MLSPAFACRSTLSLHRLSTAMRRPPRSLPRQQHRTIFGLGGGGGDGNYGNNYQMSTPINFGFCIVPQQTAYVVERLGKFSQVRCVILKYHHSSLCCYPYLLLAVLWSFVFFFFCFVLFCFVFSNSLWLWPLSSKLSSTPVLNCILLHYHPPPLPPSPPSPFSPPSPSSPSSLSNPSNFTTKNKKNQQKQ